MKGFTQLLLASALFTSTAASYAELTNAWWHDDGDGALVCVTSQTGWTSVDGTLTMHGNQFGGPGDLLGEFQANSVDDPRARKTYFIDNQTGLTWVGYTVDVYMDHAFSISNITTTADSFVPGDWTYSVVQPVANSDPQYFGSGGYVGHITFTAGTHVVDGAELDFSYDVGFSGALTYQFHDVLTPIAVPEPGSFSLLGMGACLLGGLAFHRRQQRR